MGASVGLVVDLPMVMSRRAETPHPPSLEMDVVPTGPIDAFWSQRRAAEMVVGPVGDQLD